MTEPAEGGDHLVGDVEDVVVAADLADARRDSSCGGTMTPPDACTGSPTKAPILSAPMRAHRVAEFVDQHVGEGLDAHAVPGGGTGRATTA